MTPLARLLVRRILETGPISIADYMAECLLHPEHGYYIKRHPFGVVGDFTTGPEISQMYGEIIGLALASAWAKQGRPDPCILAELGPGRGTCMADILRAVRIVPGLNDAAEVHLIEASTTLRERQRQVLGTKPITWLDSVSDLPKAPLFLIASEFFDALPIRQFVRVESGWRERLVGVQSGDLAYGLSEPVFVKDLEHREVNTRLGDIVELRRASGAVMAAVATRLNEFGGAALVVDYGDWRSFGDTLQALKGHKHVDPLAEPGLADLSAHVDFEALANSAVGTLRSPLVSQGVFFERLGITTRARALAKSLSGQALEEHIAAHRRLTHPDEMGSIFKVLGFTPKGAPPIAGLDQ